MSKYEHSRFRGQLLNSNPLNPFIQPILDKMQTTEIADLKIWNGKRIAAIMNKANLEQAMLLNQALLAVYKNKRSNEGQNPESDPLVKQIKKFQAEVDSVVSNIEAKDDPVLAKTIHAVNKELANHLDYRYGAKKNQGENFQLAHRPGDLNELMEASKDDTSRYKKVAGCALLAIGIAAMAAALVVGTIVSAGILPVVVAMVAPVVSPPVAALAAAALGGISLGGIPFFKSALKDDKVFDTAGETVKAIHRETKAQVKGAENAAFFQPKKSFLRSAADAVVSRFSAPSPATN